VLAHGGPGNSGVVLKRRGDKVDAGKGNEKS